MPNPTFIIDIGPDGIVATHPGRFELPVLVAPVPAGRKTKDFNTIRPQLIAIACKMLPGRHFAFDSSFIAPESASGFTKFALRMQILRTQDDAEPQRFPPCTIFGHADPTGDHGYNKTLAGRRARAVYGLLVREFKFWDDLYRIPFGGDRWGMRSIRSMLSIALRKDEPPYYSGALEPGSDPQEQKQINQDTADAVRAYKMARGFPSSSGTPDTATRKKLFLEYMDAICHDSQGQPFQLTRKDFLTRGKDPELKGDVQGCGDFNEIFLLTADEEAELKKTEETRKARDELYKKDRRVLVYVFKHGTVLDPNYWPCPASTDGPGGCLPRFWSDYKDRRKRTDKRREFGKDMDLFLRDEDGQLLLDSAGKPTARKVEDTGNTMSCRWYHAFAVHSPCERQMEEWIIKLRIDGFKKDQTGKRIPVPLANRRFVVLAGEASFAAEIRGRTNVEGELRIPVLDERTKMTLKLDAYDPITGPVGPPARPDQIAGTLTADKFEDEDKFLTLTLDAGALRKMTAAESDLAAKQRLYNLGYGTDAPDHWTDTELHRAVANFRRRQDAGDGDQLDDDLREKIRQEHEIRGGPAEPPSDDDDAGTNP